MTRADILRDLRVLMKTTSKEKVNWDSVGEEASIASLGFDSLSLLDLVYDVQQKFHLEFEAEELAGVRTVGDFVSWLEARVAP